jgi:ABC-2 type transport system permease protein
MARVRVIAFREWRDAVHSRSFVIVSLLLPAMMLALAALPVYLAGEAAGPASPSDAALANRFTLGLLLVLLLFLGIASQSQALLRSVMEERSTRMMEMLLSSVTPLELLLGKLAGYCAVALAQLAIWVVSGVVLTRIAGLSAALRFVAAAGIGTGVLFLCCYAVGYVLYASIYAAVGAVTVAEREANLYQQLLALTLMIPFVASASLVSNPASPLVAQLTWVPFLAPMLLLLRWAFDAVSLLEIVGSLALTALAAFAALVLAARVFQGAALLSERRLSWREAWRVGGVRRRGAVLE